MKRILIVIQIITYSIFLSFSAWAAEQELEMAEKKKITVHIFPHSKNSFTNMIEGHDIYDVENWKNMDLDRHNLEILIFHVAPVLGGCNCEINLEAYTIDTPHSRSIELVRLGEEISHPITVFSGDSRVEERLYLSDSIIDPNEFFVGLYTHEHRKDLLSMTDKEKIKKLKFVVGKDWEIDNKVLDQHGLAKVPADNWESLLFLLIKGRADVVMQPFFATDDFSFVEVKGTEKFLPIPNMKMKFPQGRTYFVSKAHPDGKEFLDALNRGIQILKDQDNLIRRAHIWAGVINPRTENFQMLFDE